MLVLCTCIDLFHTSAHHHVDKFFVAAIVDSHSINLNTIPENRDSVSNQGKLLHPVRHIDNTDSLCL